MNGNKSVPVTIYVAFYRDMLYRHKGKEKTKKTTRTQERRNNGGKNCNSTSHFLSWHIFESYRKGWRERMKKNQLPVQNFIFSSVNKTSWRKSDIHMCRQTSGLVRYCFVSKLSFHVWVTFPRRKVRVHNPLHTYRIGYSWLYEHKMALL